MIRHRPLQPSWMCSACGEPWPCAKRKSEFLEHYEGRRRQLRAVLGMFLIDAIAELPDPMEELHTRFVAWSYQRAELPGRRPGSPFTPSLQRKD